MENSNQFCVKEGFPSSREETQLSASESAFAFAYAFASAFASELTYFVVLFWTFGP